MDKVILLSNRVWIAENASNGNMQAKFVICDFSTNKNGVRLNRDTIEKWMQSMVNQPLVGKIKKDALNGVADFTGHNMKKSIIKNSDGDYETVVEFDTDAIGTFVAVDIEDVDGAECIVGTAEIWSRFPRVVNLIRERIESGTLQTSWEITVNAARKENDEKIIDDGVFTALCCLGRKVEPAYDASRLLEVAETEMDDELTSAIVEDLEAEMKKNTKDAQIAEDPVLEAENEHVETAEQTAPVPAEPVVEEPVVSEDATHADPADVPVNEPELSALTSNDLWCRITCMLREKTRDWGYIAYWFPENNMVWWKSDHADTEMDLLCFVYSVLEDDSVVVDDGIPVKLTVSIAQAQAELDKKDEAIASAAAEIAELKKSLEALESFKEAFEASEAKRIEDEREAKREKLKAYALRSGLISEADFETEEVAKMIAEVDQTGINQLIAARFMAQKNEPKAVEVSEARPAAPRQAVDLTAEDVKPVRANVLRAYIEN